MMNGSSVIYKKLVSQNCIENVGYPYISFYLTVHNFIDIKALQIFSAC